MTQLAYDNPDNYWLEPMPHEQPGKVSLLSILLGVFIVGAISVAPLAGWNYIVQAIGVVLAIAYTIRAIQTSVRPSKESMLYLAWVCWCITGLFANPHPLLFWNGMRTVFQIWILILVIVGFTTNRRALSSNFIFFLIGAFIVGGYSYITGDFQRAESGSDVDRVAGLVLNANAFSWIMLLAFVCMAYFWMFPGRMATLTRCTLLAGMTLLTLASIMTSSRKGILGLGAFILLWLWFCYRKTFIKRPLLLIATSAVLFIGTLVFIQVIMTTHAGARFTAVIDNTSDATEKRTDLYHDAWKVFSEHPISGVGLNCFVLHTQILQQAHSEYMEIAADTGIVGAILYFSIYFVMWRRAGKIVKYSSDQAAVKIAQLFRAFLVVIMLTNFGRWNYDAKTTWIMFASFIGYLCVAWNDVLANAMQPTPVTNEESVPAELPDGVNVSK